MKELLAILWTLELYVALIDIMIKLWEVFDMEIFTSQKVRWYIKDICTIGMDRETC